MDIAECVRRARSLNHQAIQYRCNGQIWAAAEYRLKRDGYMLRARESA